MSPAPTTNSNIAVPTVTYTNSTFSPSTNEFLRISACLQTTARNGSKTSTSDNFHLQTRMFNRFRYWWVAMNVTYNREYLI